MSSTATERSPVHPRRRLESSFASGVSVVGRDANQCVNRSRLGQDHLAAGFALHLGVDVGAEEVPEEAVVVLT
jgi:hypothetical protein